MPGDKNKNAISTQQELQQSLMYLEYLKEQIVALKEQSEILELAVKEHNQAIETLKDFENLDKNNEILIPIGGSHLVLCTIKDPLMEPFYIVKDATNFTVIEKSISTRGFGGKAATGKEQEKVIGYYTSFSNALNKISKEILFFHSNKLCIEQYTEKC